MLMNSCYQQELNYEIELLCWGDKLFTYSEVENLDTHEFEVFRNIFKEKAEAEAKAKQEFIKNTFEFARKCVEVICKTISGAFGTKTSSSKVN